MYKSRASLIPCLWVYALNGRTPSTPVFQMPRLRAGRADQPFMEGAVGACGSSSDSWTYQPRKTKMENENEWRYIYIYIKYIYIIHITMKFKDQSWKNYSGLKYWFSSPFHWQSFQHLPPSKRWGRWSLHTWGREAPCWSSTAQRHDPQQVPLGSINSLYRGWSGPTFNDGNPYNGAL